jgi:hypothetical protein
LQIKELKRFHFSLFISKMESAHVNHCSWNQ